MNSKKSKSKERKAIEKNKRTKTEPMQTFGYTEERQLFWNGRADPTHPWAKSTVSDEGLALPNTRGTAPSGSHPHSLETPALMAHRSHPHLTAPAGEGLGLITWPCTPDTLLSMFQFKVSKTTWRLHRNPTIPHFQSMEVRAVCCACSKTQMSMLGEC